MLTSAIVIYIMCMPMGYIVGRQYVNSMVNKYEHTIDRETKRKDLSFVPILTSVLLPMGAILAIFEIMNEETQ